MVTKIKKIKNRRKFKNRKYRKIVDARKCLESLGFLSLCT